MVDWIRWLRDIESFHFVCLPYERAPTTCARTYEFQKRITSTPPKKKNNKQEKKLTYIEIASFKSFRMLEPTTFMYGL